MRASERPTPVLWLDLDDTVRHDKKTMGRTCLKPEDVVIFPEVVPLLRRYKQAGWRIVGISNQSGITRGDTTREQVAVTLQRTHELCENLFDRLSFCPHDPGAKNPADAICWCRKPRIGMLVATALDMGNSWPEEFYPPYLGLLVGDRDSDRDCAANAGIAFMDAVTWRLSINFDGIIGPTWTPLTVH